jgi:S1-C subfamily serine protease
LIGVATAQIAHSSGVAVPLDTIERVSTALQQHGRMRRGYLGIGSQPVALPENLRSHLSLTQPSALLIVSVEPGSPADRAGLILGDVLVSLGGETVRNTDDLLELLGPERVGQPAAVRVLRGGELRDLTVTVGERS